MTVLQWLAANADVEPRPIAKETTATRAWFATLDGGEVFAKAYPPEFAVWAEVEASISGASLHPALVPLRQRVECDDGILLIYDRVNGDSLGPQEARARFAALPLNERTQAVRTAVEAVAAVHAAGFMVVGW